MEDGTIAGIAAAVVFLAVIILVPLGMWGCPVYSVWQQAREGEAELNKAEYNRQVAVQEAKAKFESSKLLADSEVERAKGVAAANKIIGDSLKGNESYLRYLWITGLEHGQEHVIYIPTEAGLPILEAGRAVEKSPVGK